MSAIASLLRLWAGRLFWLLVACTLTIMVTFLPAGLVRTSDAPIAPRQVMDDRNDPLEPLLIRPWDQWHGAEYPWSWSPVRYKARIGAYVRDLGSGNLIYVQSGFYAPEEHPMIPLLKEGLLYSLLIFGAALVGGCLLGLLLGALAVGPRLTRALSLGISVGGLALPDFCLVLMGQLLTIWTYKNWGFRLWTVGVPGGERHYLLPILALSIAPMAYMARLTVAALDEIMREDYIRTARSKGIPEPRVIFGHGFRNAIPRILNGVPTIVNVTLASLVVVELLTSWPGLGRYLIAGASGSPALLATTGLIFCLWFTLLDGLANTVRLLANPRLKEANAA